MLPVLLYCRIGEIGFYKVHLSHPEALAIQIGKATAVGCELKGQFVRIQRLIGAVKAFIQLAVLTVTQKRVPCVGKLGADLVGSACNQLTFHQRKAVGAGKYLVIGLASFRAGLGRICHKNPVLFGILE